ncbi:MAG: serine aminopeptidase domain-containing protein [Aeromicrobium sp.]
MPEPIVLISAAMAVPSGVYRPLVTAFADHGWEARALPTLGFERGQPSASRSHDWSYDDAISGIADAVTAARAEDPDRPVMLLGHSLGSQLCAGHQLHRDPADVLVVVGGSLPYFRAYPHGGLPVLFLGLSVPVITRIRGFVPQPFFGGPGPRTLMGEWARLVRTGRPPFAVPHKVKTPTLVVQLQGDAYSVPNATDKFIDTFIDPSALTRWVYAKDKTPDGGSTDHVLWVRTPGVVVDRIVDWYTGIDC